MNENFIEDIYIYSLAEKPLLNVINLAQAVQTTEFQSLGAHTLGILVPSRYPFKPIAAKFAPKRN
jgi:hypothetical protein